MWLSADRTVSIAAPTAPTSLDTPTHYTAANYAITAANYAITAIT